MMISPDYKYLFSEPRYCFYLFGGAVMYRPKIFQAIGLENRDWVKTDTDIRTQVVLGFLSSMDFFFLLEGMYIELMFIITLKIKCVGYRKLISAYHE